MSLCRLLDISFSYWIIFFLHFDMSIRLDILILKYTWIVGLTNLMIHIQISWRGKWMYGWIGMIWSLFDGWKVLKVVFLYWPWLGAEGIKGPKMDGRDDGEGICLDFGGMLDLAGVLTSWWMSLIPWPLIFFFNMKGFFLEGLPLCLYEYIDL